jgi:uncharacterized small protein (DUF1192 family)
VQRNKAVKAIEDKISEVQAKLVAASATSELSNKALLSLQELKGRVATLTSIAQILYLQTQAGDAMDESISLIDAAMAKPTTKQGSLPKSGETGQPDSPSKPTKSTHVIRAAELSSKTYLETEADVDAYVEKLKAELLKAVRSGQIARIQ